MRSRTATLLGIMLVFMALCSTIVGAEDVKLALDWTPNTNHTGIYVALELGYFADEGLTVQVIQPGPTTSIQLTGTGKTEFGISMQEYVTMSRSQGVPVVSIGTVIQHNTSGFAALSEKQINCVQDFEGKRYGGWGQKLEEVMIRTAMNRAGADSSAVVFVNIGMIDSFVAAQRDLADFFWVFYGWAGINARLQGIDFTYLPLVKLAEVFDYYTPVIITSEQLIEESPDLVRRFMRAISQGYLYAAENPQQAAQILIRAVPELDETLVDASLLWLADRFVDDSPLWGLQRQEVWERFAEWSVENGLIDSEIDAEGAFTNEFLLTEEGEG